MFSMRSSQRFTVFASARKLHNVHDVSLKGIDVLQLDVTHASSVQTAVDWVVSEAGGIDLLVCNAGLIRYVPIIEQELSCVKAVFDTNVFGTLLCARAVASVMINQRSGVIAVSSSISASLKFKSKQVHHLSFDVKTLLQPSMLTLPTRDV